MNNGYEQSREINIGRKKYTVVYTNTILTACQAALLKDAIQCFGLEIKIQNQEDDMENIKAILL